MKSMKKVSKVLAAAAIAAAMSTIPAMSVSAETPVQTAPGAAGTQAAADVAKAPGAKAARRDIRIAKVISVSDAGMTVELGAAPEKKEKPADTAADGTNAQKPAKKVRKSAEGITANGTADGTDAVQRPVKKDKAEKQFTSSGETVTVPAGVKVTKNGQAAALSDIAAGDIITLVYDGENITEVSIGRHGRPDGGRQGRRPEKKEQAAPVQSTVTT